MTFKSKNIIKISLFLLFILLVIYLGYSYRIRQYQIIPKVNTTFDEMEYLWLGKSLLSTGIPVSWYVRYNFLDQNKLFAINKTEINQIQINNYNLAVDGKKPDLLTYQSFPKPLTFDIEADVDGYRSQFLIIQPFLVNPPLTGIVLALFDNGNSLLHSTISNIRLAPIIFLSLSVGIILLLGYFLSSFRAGVISALIYALGPGYVISSRLAVPENLLAAIFPVAILALLFYLRSSKTYLLISLILIAFLSPLFKVTGIIIPFAVSSVLLYRRKFKPAIFVFISMLIGLLAFIGYGLFFDSNLFMQIQLVHAGRDFLGPLGMLVKMVYPEIPVPIFDGWILMGFLSLIFLVWLKDKTDFDLIIFSILSYFLFFLIFGGENYPWYQFIVFPLLALSAGLVLDYFIKKPSLLYNFLFFVITLSALIHYSRFKIPFLDYLNSYRFFVLLFVLIPVGLFLFKIKNNRFLSLSLILMFLLSLYLGTRIINNMQALYPYLETLKFPLSEAYCCSNMP